MISWNEYIEEMLSTPSVLDNMLLQCGKDLEGVVSPIVKASIQMLEDMISTEGRHNVFVFPEIKELLYEIVISKIVYNVAAGKINIAYDPHMFKPGQKLKYKTCIVEFDRYVENDFDGAERMYIRFSDGGRRGLPPKIAPIFQIADKDARKFSSEKAFSQIYSAQKAFEEIGSAPEHKDIINALTDYKTHLDGSIFLITNVSAAKEYFDQIYINGIPLKDVLLIGRVRSGGGIGNCYPGQLSGNPAIVLASDFYSVYEAICKGAKVQSIIVNASQNALLENQLDVIDNLSREEFPILCLTNTSNSFDLNLLSDRNYNIWRWDKTSIVDGVFDSSSEIARHKIKNCMEQRVEYERVECDYIDQALKMLYSRKNEISEQGTDVVAVYNKLFSLLFTSLRIAVPFEQEEITRAKNTLTECERILINEKRFLNPELFEELSSVVNYFSNIYKVSFENPKVCKIAEILESKKYSSVCIVIADRFDKAKCEAYWVNYSVRRHIPTVVKVMFPQEYANSDVTRYDATIIVGWLNNKNMRNIIHSYSTSDYIVITYPCEDKWRKSHMRAWNKALSSNHNHRIVKNSFCKKVKSVISEDRFVVDSSEIAADYFDELSDIETVIQTNTYRQYGVSSGSGNQIVDAYPISFVGGYLAFYRTGHKVITVTDIIASGKDSAIPKKPEELSVGDFVVVRKSQHDIIKEIADKILAKSGLNDARSLALRWKESLSIETMFSTTEDIYRRLQSNGCVRGFQTVKNWIEDEEQFSLASKEDLICIAVSINDDILMDSIDAVYEAGVQVKRAHIKAGQYLSQKLKSQIADNICQLENVDAFNIWDPIVLRFEDIGKISILKIIDINKPIKIDIGNTNRLLSE